MSQCLMRKSLLSVEKRDIFATQCDFVLSFGSWLHARVTVPARTDPFDALLG